MSLLDGIERLRQKPEPARRRLRAAALAAAITIVFGLWFLRLSQRQDIRAATATRPAHIVTDTVAEISAQLGKFFGGR